MNTTEESVVSPSEQDRYEELLGIAVEYARNGQREDLEPMLKAGLPVDLQDQKGNSLLMLAAYHGQLETVRLLLDFGANAELKNDRGQRPLGGVAFKGYIEVAQLLIDRGADVNGDNGGKMPMLFALMFGRLKMVKLLRRSGGRIRA